MALLKKIKASTLMETLIATVLIIVIFVVSSFILNNLFNNVIKNDTRAVASKLNELEYLYINKKISIPYQDEYGDWILSVKNRKQDALELIIFSAENLATKKLVESIIHNQ
ncbi:hypothetical protein [uncultured Psychroserpens sp.]|uniref:hypothetical protein n=1 Tax=uncultured Psychroserpens sp. TaxID=255436 RepID=UPI0026320C14|nr:hypothetical protein [uncultured Psychroserpens sp.]